jgi:hypothetical protein
VFLLKPLKIAKILLKGIVQQNLTGVKSGINL